MAFLIVAAPLARAAAKCCAEGAGAVALGGGAADGSGGAADEGSSFFSALTGGGVSGGKPKKNLADYGAVGEDDLAQTFAEVRGGRVLPEQRGVRFAELEREMQKMAEENDHAAAVAQAHECCLLRLTSR